jgi:hypothetical protein
MCFSPAAYCSRPVRPPLHIAYARAHTGILYNEWSARPFEDVLGSLVGLATTVIGIFEMQLFRDVPITWNHLQMMMRKQQQMTRNGSGTEPPYMDLDDHW